MRGLLWDLHLGPWRAVNRDRLGTLVLAQFQEDIAMPQTARFRGFADHNEMLREFRPNVVLITVEAHRAPERIRAALEAGSHVLTEKPACVRVADFEALARIAEGRRLNLMLAMANRMAGPV